MQTQELLKQRGVDFEVVSHPATYDAARLAQMLRVKGHGVAKTVLIHANHGFTDIVAVLPADCSVDLRRLSHALGGAEVRLANEQDIVHHCPDCEVGVLPPFGSQYGMKTVVDERLTHEEQIVFEGNKHDQAIRMRFADYCRVESPLIASFATECTSA